MSSLILITGGTGTLGRHLTPLLTTTGHQVRVLSRRTHDQSDDVEHVTGDLLRDEGIDAAVAGAGTVVHLAGGPKDDDVATANLVRAASRAGVRHLVYISVIGADSVPLRYFRAKLAAEEAVASSGVPWTTLRAAQFHTFVLTAVEAMTRMPVVPAPGGLRFQPVDARDVAARLVELALGPASGRVADLAGPRVHSLTELARDYLEARGRRRLFVPVRIPGKAGAVYRAGDNLNLSTAEHGTRTWEDFLAEQVPAWDPQPAR